MKILVIDDNPIVRALIFDMLQPEDCEVIRSRNAWTGVQLARIYRPNLIICDLTMPELNGYEILARLRQDPVTAGIPFVFLGPDEQEPTPDCKLKVKPDAYLPLSFERADLLRVIAEQLLEQEQRPLNVLE